MSLTCITKRRGAKVFITACKKSKSWKSKRKRNLALAMGKCGLFLWKKKTLLIKAETGFILLKSLVLEFYARLLIHKLSKRSTFRLKSHTMFP